ncbi:hypothetical protein J5X84_36225 [Streptosporangiaceae bacterium NEAU-GS5]|nr:hypothetical protein [Streptosporangiaceae bacterium NEAU-GS5]
MSAFLRDRPGEAKPWGETTSLLSFTGDLTLSKAADGTLTVVRADPRILIAAEVLEELADGNGHPSVTLADDVLTIDAANQRVIYRITDYGMPANVYLAEWPD